MPISELLTEVRPRNEEICCQPFNISGGVVARFFARFGIVVLSKLPMTCGKLCHMKSVEVSVTLRVSPSSGRTPAMVRP